MAKLLLYSILFLTSITVAAQSNITSSGKNISNANGSVKYSIGQIFYQSQNGSSGALSSGVQIPVETLTLSTSEDVLLSFTAKIYPNPTVKDIYIQLKNLDHSELTYQLFTVQGKLIERSTSTLKEHTKVSMKQLPANVYLLQIISKNQILKTYKIIKNQ